MTGGSAIRATGLTKTYGKLVAVDHVNMDVRVGGVFGLLGPNGAGKTTIIKVLTGLSDITEGEATVAGFDVRTEPMHVKERIGWVAAEVILDDDFSGWENLWLQARLQRLSGWKTRAGELLQYFALTERKGDKVGTYSTGMRKKLEIALALLHQPEVIFMDEPTIGLDASTRRSLWELITGVNREFGVTVLLTSHYIEEADALCDQISIIDQGRFIATGSPNELKARVKADYIEVDLTDATGPMADETLLRSIPGVSEVRAQGKTWILKTGSAEEVLPKMFQTVGTERIRKVNVEKPSLESVFIEMTGKKIDQASTDVHDYRKFYMNVRRSRQ
jgi:ABC-2 type transport system ATP-binding protein